MAKANVFAEQADEQAKRKLNLIRKRERNKKKQKHLTPKSKLRSS